jgi:NADPH:quinone reductase-like Zn-dependent oxidoreductase
MTRSVRIHEFGDATLRPTIARTFPFEQIAQAHRFMESGGQVGKIVITV